MKIIPASAQTKKTASNRMLFGFGALSLLLVGVFLFVKNKKKPKVINPNLISLGQYQFDKRNAVLKINGIKEELSGKEADLLLLLHKHANETIERDVILNKVWGDEGDYIGRTLDVFISKLRKKLDRDPNVKIVNIRGVGYKLVVE